MTRKAVILAAGMGTRLRPLTDSEHKCMTKVCGVPIIYHALDCLEKCGFSEVVIVVGYLKKQLESQIQNFHMNMKIRFAENDLYNQTNTAYSLKLGLDEIDNFDELYILEGDVFFDDVVLKRLITEKHPNATILEHYNPELDGTFATLNKEGFVVDWRHKSEQEPGYTLTDKYKTVNLHRFSVAFVKEILIAENERLIESMGCNQPLEKTMRQIVSQDPMQIKGVILNKERWFEIDDLRDLEYAEQLFGKEQ